MPGKDNVVRKSAEYTGRTVEEAVAAAVRDLGVSAANLKYQVLRDTSHSFLGLVRTGETTIVVDLEDDDTDVSAPAAGYAEYTDDDEFEDDEQEDDDYPDDEDDVDEDDAESESELEAIATEVLATLLDKMGYYAAVEVQDACVEDEEDDEPLRLNIVGDDVTALIGRRGETLRDLQFITRLIVSRQMGDWPNIVLDVEGYKERRSGSLRALALRLADQVRETGEPVTLEPMPSYERRIVHLTLRDAEGVYTESTGEDEARKVQILPR